MPEAFERPRWNVFAGAIRYWDDPRIAEANPHLGLPHRDIRIAGRLDSSGTISAVTNHLEAASAVWRAAGEGAATAVDWPGSAMHARGEEGVPAQVLRTDGAIGYVEYGFASRSGLPMATLRNAAGDWAKPSPEAGAVALDAANIPGDLKIVAHDPAQRGAFPIVTFTWALLHEQSGDDPRRAEARSFVASALQDGQQSTVELGYAPLGPKLRTRAQAALALLL